MLDDDLGILTETLDGRIVHFQGRDICFSEPGYFPERYGLHAVEDQHHHVCIGFDIPGQQTPTNLMLSALSHLSVVDHPDFGGFDAFNMLGYEFQPNLRETVVQELIDAIDAVEDQEMII